MPRIIVLITLFSLFFINAFFTNGGAVLSSDCVNSHCMVSASASLASLIIGFLLALFVVLFPREETIIDKDNIVGLMRRFAAFFMDFMTVLIVFTPFAVLPLLLAEADYTGAFSWNFERDYARPTDNNYALPGIFSLFIALYLYFYLYARFNKQTLGQYIMGYKVVAEDESTDVPIYFLRPLLSYFGICMWPISAFFASRNENKACWWDGFTNTKVVRLKSTSEAG